MENYIIIAVIAVIAVFAIYSTARHFKGKGCCCGAGEYKVQKKKLPTVKYRKTFTIEGMHCESCKKRVEELMNDIDGIAGSVDLRKGVLTVLYATDIKDEIIMSKIEKAGYSATRTEGVQ